MTSLNSLLPDMGDMQEQVCGGLLHIQGEMTASNNDGGENEGGDGGAPVVKVLNVTYDDNKNKDNGDDKGDQQIVEAAESQEVKIVGDNEGVRALDFDDDENEQDDTVKVFRPSPTAEVRECAQEEGQQSRARAVASFPFDDSDDVQALEIVDHFSLKHPTSTVKFRGNRVHVVESNDNQYILEEKGRQITVKRMSVGNFGLKALKLFYTLVSLVVLGFLFVFCFQILLFVFLNIPVEPRILAQRTGKKQLVITYTDMIGSILSIPIFLVGMASLMAMCTAFVIDTWNGGELFRSVMGWSDVLTAVLYLTFFLLIPVLSFIVGTLQGLDDPWEVTALVWVCSIAFSFCVFAFNVAIREIKHAFTLTAIYHGEELVSDDGEGEEVGPWRKRWLLIKRAALSSQMQRYSGLHHERYLVSGDDEPPVEGYSLSKDYNPVNEHTGLWARITGFGCFGDTGAFFKRVDPPQRLYTTDEVRDILPYLTGQTWSLGTFCCRGNSNLITAAGGPSALRPGQLRMSLACSMFGMAMFILVIIGLVSWADAGAEAATFAAILCIIFGLIPLTFNSLSVLRVYRNVRKDKKFLKRSGRERQGLSRRKNNLLASQQQKGRPSQGSQGIHENHNNDIESPNFRTYINESDERKDCTMFQVWETVQVTKPRAFFCYTLIVLEILIFGIWPLASLLSAKNYPIAVVFFIMAVWTLLRRYFDSSAILLELGSMSNVDVEINPGANRPIWSVTGRNREGLGGTESTLLIKARLSAIIGTVSRSRSIRRWMCLFFVLVLLVFLLFLSALSLDSVQPSNRPPIELVSDFYYEEQPDTLAYPTCNLQKGFTIPGMGTGTALGDYAFMAAIAYETTNVTEVVLDKWFGEGMVVDENDFVAEWRRDAGNELIPTYFKFFTFPTFPGIGLVSIRGSETSWDWLINMQLWSASGLVQLVKWLTPFGWVWTPILDDLVTAVSFMENSNLEKVGYYRVTTQFVNDILENGYRNDTFKSFDTLRVTGASLGGGIAIITGAQTNAKAVAISGLGAELTRNALDPPVTLEALNNNVFNWIPDRDIIARIGGRSRLFQEGQCTGKTNSPATCHSMWRSVCEINYRCGTNGRPVLCMCKHKFGYPKPTAIGNRTFEEACPLN